MPVKPSACRRAAHLSVLVAAALAAGGLAAAPASASTATVCHSSGTSITGPGEPLNFDGQVTTTTGAAVAGVRASLDKWNGRVWRSKQRKRTDSTGRTHFTITLSATTTYRVSYAGGRTFSACATPMVAVWLSNDSRVLASAASHNGQPYEYGAAGPSSFDCSGLMLYVFAGFGRSLPHNSQLQYNAVHHISTSSLTYGDLVFFGSSPTGIYHVGMYAGGGYIWHAPGDGQTVKIEKIWTSAYYAGRV